MKHLLILATLLFAGEPYRWGEDSAPAAESFQFVDSLADIKLDLTPIEQMQVKSLPVQWLVFTSETCIPCKQARNDYETWMQRGGWRVGNLPGDNVFHIYAQADPAKHAEFHVESYPMFVLLENGREVERHTRYPGRQYLVDAYNARANLLKQRQPEQPTGLAIGTIKAKEQVTSLFSQLKPFLDGGAATFTYAPRPGVVREYLEFRAGSAGIRIPAKTVATLKFEGDMLRVDFSPGPTLLAAGIVREVQSVELTVNRLSIQLPWMIDPEWRIE
jgi:hypothetical protein